MKLSHDTNSDWMIYIYFSYSLQSYAQYVALKWTRADLALILPN